MKSLCFKIILLFLISTSTFVFGQSICDEAVPLCSNDNFTGDPPDGNPWGNLDGGCVDLEADDVAWYLVRIQSGTTFTFVIDPDTGGDDYDFAVWKNPDCDDLGVADRASYSAVGYTGLRLNEPDTCEDVFGTGIDGMVRHIDVVPGDEILIAIDKYEDNGDGFTLIFGDGGSGEGNAELDCTILGETYGQCDEDLNGQENFDLNAIAADITVGEPTWTVDFYEVETDAQAGNTNTESSPYTALTVNNPTELFARIEDGGNFMRIVKIFLHVNELPQLTSPVDLPSLCDLGGDGEEVFDLTLAESDLVTDPTLYFFKYYETEPDAIAGGLNNINPATAYPSGTATIYVRVETGPLDGNVQGCFSIGEINLLLTEREPSEFDLTDQYCINSTPPALPTTSVNGIDGTWNPAVIDTSVIGTDTYTFTPNSGECGLEYVIDIEIVEGVAAEFTIEDTYCAGTTAPVLPSTSNNGIDGTWSPSNVINTSTVGVTTYTFTPDDPECTVVFEIEIEIINGVALTSPDPIEICDDNFDGTFEYNLTDLNDLVLVPSTGYTFAYFLSQADADNNNPIPTTQWNNYPISVPTSLWVAATGENGCRSEAVEVEFIEGQGISLLSGPYEIPFCEGETVNLTEFEEYYTVESGVDFSYYQTQTDAEVQTGEITGILNFDPTGVGSIFVRLELQHKCPQIIEVDFVAGQEVQHNAGPYGPIEYCEGDVIDVTSYTSSIPNESDVDIFYYLSLNDAENESNPIPDETAFSPQGSGTIFVRLEKAGRCTVILEIEFEQRTSPSIEDLPAELILCEGQETIDLEVSSDDPNATFEWTWDGTQTYTGASITITEIGAYTLTVTGSNGCKTTEEMIVRPGGEPAITSIESADTYLIVFAESGNGGMLEYSLNGVLWQDSPRFDNLIKGEIYTIYVREDGCLVKTYTTALLNVANFVSPNGDGYNDQWSIRGIEITPNATLKIFDRYGKIFVDTTFDGDYIWDGKYNGMNVPAGSYWYIMEVPTDGVVPARKFVGHISVRN